MDHHFFYADVAELADALDLGSSSREWGFKSLHPHHKKPCKTQGFFVLFIQGISRKAFLFCYSGTFTQGFGVPLTLHRGRRKALPVFAKKWLPATFPHAKTPSSATRKSSAFCTAFLFCYSGTFTQGFGACVCAPPGQAKC